MECRFLLNVVIGQRTPIFELLTSKDESLLIRGDALFVLNLRLNIFDCIGCLYFQCDGFTGKSLDEDLHTAAQSQHEMQR
uniref:Uncharacterized protein n=1 Tax=Parascaris univalens TaxID=6257 RepID=A0A914ZTG7_PARUN